jgi:hypothetical protein
MCRRYTEPLRSNFDTEEEYQEELDAYEREEYWRAEYAREEYALANPNTL